MKSILFALMFGMLITSCSADVKPVKHEWMRSLEDMQPNNLVQSQEQAPSRLRCHTCLEPLSLENCTAAQTLRLCETGFHCYTLQAFDISQDTHIFAKGCLPEIMCLQGRGCEFLNLSRNGTIESCSFTCCGTQDCNAQTNVSSTAAPIPTTTEERTTAVIVPTTTVTIPVKTPSGKCGGSLSASSGNIASPNYPSSYPNNADCVWTISVPQGSTFRIEFVYFLMERRYDDVKIYVGRQLLRHLTGRLGRKDKVVSIQGRSEVVRVVFRSDRTVTRRGFFAKYSVMKALSCGGSLSGSSGNLKSPGYPAHYPNDIKCKWTITVPRGSSLTLEFRAFATERCYDYLKIYRGRRLVRRLSGRYSRYRRYRGGDDKRVLPQNDDDCDDDDDEISDDGANVDDNFKRTYGRYRHVRRAGNRYGSRARSEYEPRIRGRYRSRYVTRVFIRGTGKRISIIFKANHRHSGKGFYATYRVSRAQYGR